MDMGIIKQGCTPITPKTTEWLTIGLIGFNLTAFLLLTWFYEQLPLWVVLPIGGYLIALFGSLQHEVLHGHPTPSQWLNEAMIFPNLALWMPYTLYKSTHLTHHINEQLTNPSTDPESYYLSTAKWQSLSRWQQAYYRFYNTFIGRFFWGPVHVIVTLWIDDARSIISGNKEIMRHWVIHALACLPVLYWVLVICEIPLWAYWVLFVYPGLSLTLLRSFVEHQAVDNVGERSIIVETNPLISLMFLNNNLHAIHHQNPHLAWFRIPMVWQSDREGVLADNRHYYFAGYWQIICRYWKTPKEQPNYPL